MQFFIYIFQFNFPYHISTDNIVTAFNVLKSVMQNIDRGVYHVIIYVGTCHGKNLWANHSFSRVSLLFNNELH